MRHSTSFFHIHLAHVLLNRRAKLFTSYSRPQSHTTQCKGDAEARDRDGDGDEKQYIECATFHYSQQCVNACEGNKVASNKCVGEKWF